MIRLFLSLVLLVFSSPLAAGIAYRFDVTTSGTASSTFTGRVEAEGANVRMSVERGDNILFKSGAIILSNDGGRTMHVVDPSTRTFFTMSMADLLRELSQMKLTGSHVSVKNLGDGGVIEGYPTRRSTLDLSYDGSIEAVGAKMHVDLHTDAWRSERLPAEAMNFFQMKGFRTGDPAVDTMIEQADAHQKGLPLKEVTTVKVSLVGTTTTVTTTSTISAIQQRPIPATEFVIPPGYKKTQNPMEKMLGAIR